AMMSGGPGGCSVGRSSPTGDAPIGAALLTALAAAALLVRRARRRAIQVLAAGFALLLATGTAEAKPKVVLLHIGDSLYTDVQTKLVATALFDAVDVIDLTVTTPSVSDL